MGGSSTRSFNLAKGLSLNGCNVTVIAGFPHYPKGKIPTEYAWKPFKMEMLGNIRVFRTFMPPLASKGLFMRILLIGVFAISSLFVFPLIGKIDAVWASSWVPGIFYSKAKRKPLILNENDLTLEDLVDLNLISKGSFILKIAEWVFLLILSKGHVVTPISPGYVETISKKYRVKQSKIHVIEIGVDLNVFRNSALAHDNTYRVIYVGVLGVGYDFEQIFRAAKVIEEIDGDVEFILHGDGECLGEVKNRIKELNLINVKLSDKLFSSKEEVVALLNKADALILPLKDYAAPYLGIPSKLYEYQAVGKPIICCARGQPAEYISETNSGVLLNPGDHESLVKCVTYLKAHPEEAGLLGASGRNHVETKESIVVIGMKMKELLSRITVKVESP